MLVDAIGKRAEDIPQAFTPYKEVLDVYDQGLELPDDVTIIWPDDNYGYIKRLSSPKAVSYTHLDVYKRQINNLW